MRNKNLIFILILIFLWMIFVACENMNRKTEVVANQKVITEKVGTKEKIEKINMELEKLILTEKYDDILKYYTDDIIICPDFQSEIKGKDAIKAIYDKNKKEGLKHHSFNGSIKELWECDNLVYERGTFGMSVSSTDHPKPLAYYGSYLTIWKKVHDGSLKIKYVIWNLDFNPCK